MRLFAGVLLLVAMTAAASTYVRDGGTADYQCCADKACTTVISQHADPVRAENACGALTDKDGVTRWTRSQAFRIGPSTVVTPPPPPPPPTGSTTLSWTPPTQNTDGSTLTNLAGYRIAYGTSATALTQTIQVANAGISSYVVNGLAPGTYYFAVRSYSSSGSESANSNVASKTL